MPLESTILCVDNSEYMRNGDYIPNRALAQQDAVNMICHSKTRSNPENNVGLITMADKQVLVTLTTDSGKIMNQMHLVQPNGLIDFLTSIKIAHLALKHRQGRNHKMKIIVFIGSPVEVDEKELVKIAKKLKKEKVNVDIVNFGETLANTDKMTTFINTINGKEGTGSHIITIPPGPVLSEALMTSPIMVDDSDGAGGAGMSGSGYSGGSMMSGFDFGIDPNSDPELALALRVSMEEQRARQEAETRAAQQGVENDGNKDGLKPTTDAVITEMPMEGEAMGGMSEEEALLNRALAMSMGVAGGSEDHDLTEEEQIALALQMSLQPEETEQMDIVDDEHDSNKKGTGSSGKNAKDKH